MTFIASVIAKKGVAVIADSLVTSSLPILHRKKFTDYIASKVPNDAGEISITPSDISALFEWETSHTKDFEEKLFKLNEYTAITTTGIATMNNKKMIDLVNEFIAVRNDIEDFSINIDTKLDQFTGYLVTQIKEHLTKYQEIGSCTFMISFYEKSAFKTHVYRLTTMDADASVLTNDNFEYIMRIKESDWIKVACDGQNKLSHNILYGFGLPFYSKFKEIVRRILEPLALPEGTIPTDYAETLRADPYFHDLCFSDIEMLNLSDLSLQQAVDLASLLMRLEIDFQKYTKNIPTVGGVVKLAIIDEKGFRYILGENIEPPKHIHL